MRIQRIYQLGRLTAVTTTAGYDRLEPGSGSAGLLSITKTHPENGHRSWPKASSSSDFIPSGHRSFNRHPVLLLGFYQALKGYRRPGILVQLQFLSIQPSLDRCTRTSPASRLLSVSFVQSFYIFLILIRSLVTKSQCLPTCLLLATARTMSACTRYTGMKRPVCRQWSR